MADNKQKVLTKVNTNIQEPHTEATPFDIKRMIYIIRNQQVMIDSDLAMLYQVETKRLNEAVKRNISRFPEEFCFQLTTEELESLRSQIATLNESDGRGKHRKYLLEQIFEYISEHTESSQKIFFDGQIYDAFSLIVSLIKKANKEITLIDGYDKNIP